MEKNELTRAQQQFALLQETTKEQRKEFVEEIIGQVEGGHTDPLEVLVQLKGTESLIEMFTDKKKYPATASRFNGLVLDAAGKYGAKTFELHNASFTIAEAGTQYDWSVCGDEELNVLLAEQEEIKAKIKQRQDFLKTVHPHGIELVDTGNGEITTVYPPAKTSTTCLKTTLK